MMDELVPLAAVFCIFGLPFVTWTFFRVLAHRERMEMMRQGYAPSGLDGRRFAAGAPGPRPGPVPVQDAGSGCYDDDHQVTLRKGIRLAMIGFALFIGLSFIGYHDDSWRPGPWLLGGLIPMFVGLAQIMIAMLSGATFRQPTWQAGNGLPPPPQMPPPSANVPPTYDGSYTYRPGDTPELRQPTPPPERR